MNLLNGMLCLVAQSCVTLCDPVDYGLPGSSVHGIFQARILEWVAISFSRRSSWPRNWTRVSHIVGRCFTIWATGKPKNSGVGSLSLLQQIFPIQESNLGLLHCRWIVYQLSYQGSPIKLEILLKIYIFLSLKTIYVLILIHCFLLKWKSRCPFQRISLDIIFQVHP